MPQNSQNKTYFNSLIEFVPVLTRTAEVKKNDNPNVGKAVKQPELLFFTSTSVK